MNQIILPHKPVMHCYLFYYSMCLSETQTVSNTSSSLQPGVARVAVLPSSLSFWH